MQNIRELREDLAEIFDKTYRQELPTKVCKELTNTAGKILTSLKVELEYNQFMEVKKTIDFLEYKS